MSLTRFAALFALVGLVPATAHAQSTITACYVPKTGSVYRIKAEGAPDACKSNHVEFSWQSGGMTFTKRFAAAVVVVPNSYGQSFAGCEADETVTGGGYSAFPNLPVAVAVNAPTFGGAHPNAWFIDMRNLSASDVSMTAYVICAKPAS